MPYCYKYKPLLSRISDEKGISTIHSAFLYPSVSLREVVNMVQVQLLCVVLCLAVAMAITQPDGKNVPNESSKPGKIQPTKIRPTKCPQSCVVSNEKQAPRVKRYSTTGDILERVTFIGKRQEVMEIRQLDLGPRIERTEAMAAEMLNRQKSMWALQGEMRARSINMEVRQLDLGPRIERTEAMVGEMQNRQKGMEARQGEMQSRQKGVEARQADMQSRQKGMEARQAEMQSRQKGMEARQAEMRARSINIEIRQLDIGGRLERVEARQGEMFELLRNVSANLVDSGSK